MADIAEEVIEGESVPSPQEMADQREFHRKINDWFERCATQRQYFEQQWYYNLAFYFGKQWVQWVGNQGNPQSLRLTEPPAPSWRVRLTSNKVKPIIRNELTKLTKEEFQGFVVPNTTDEQDLVASRAAENIAEYLFEEVKFNKHRRAGTLWAVLTGTGFVKVIWDENKKDSSGTPGCIDVSAPSPFNIFVPILQEEEIDNQPYVIHAITMTADQVWDRWEVKLDPDSEVGGGVFEQKLLNVLGINRQNSPEKMVLVKEIWIRPCKKYPEGLVCFYTTAQILEIVDGWPYKHGRYPIRKIVHIPTTKFYGDSVIVDLIPLQREYNKNRSSIIESKNRMAKPQLLAVQGSIDPNKITSEPGLIIQYKMGFPAPTPLPLQALPAYVLQELDRTLQDMDDTSGQYEVTKGRTPPGVEAASAIAYLQEENDSRLHHTVASIEEVVSDVGKQMLSLAGQYWTEGRMIRVVGKTSAFEAKMFKGSDLNGNYDFRIEAGSMAPRSRAAKQAYITDLIKNQIITPEMGLKYLQMSETNALFNELQVDIRQAQRENVKMSQLELPKPPELPMPNPFAGTMGAPPVDPMMQDATMGMGMDHPPADPMAAVAEMLGGGQPPGEEMMAGAPTDPLSSLMGGMGQPPMQDPMEQVAFMTVPVNPFDNHTIHEREHARYMKTQEFELLEDHQKSAILKHWEEHRMKLQEIAAASQDAGVEGMANPQEEASGLTEEQPVQ